MRKAILSEICGKTNDSSGMIILYYYPFTVLSNAKKCNNHDMLRSVGEGSFNLEETICWLCDLVCFTAVLCRHATLLSTDRSCSAAVLGEKRCVMTRITAVKQTRHTYSLPFS